MEKGVDWGAGTYLENSQRQRKAKLKVRDKIIEERVNAIVTNFISDSGLSHKNIENVKRYVRNEVFKYSTNLRRNSKPKPTLRGSPLDLTINATLYNAILGSLLTARQYLPESYFFVLAEIFKKFQTLKDFKKIEEKAEFLTECQMPDEYYDIGKVDKFAQRYKEKEFVKLFSLDRRMFLEKFKPAPGNNDIFFEHEDNDIRVFADYVGDYGYFKAIQILLRIPKDKNKVRIGLCGACSYVLAEEYYLNGSWMKPEKSMSEWANFYGIDREVFAERVQFVKDNLLKGEYLPFDFLFIIPSKEWLHST